MVTDLARLWCVRLVRDLGEIVAQQVELQLHGFERRFHGSLPVALEAPCTTQASDDVLWGTPGELIPPRVPPSCSAPVHGDVDAEEQSVESPQIREICSSPCLHDDLRDCPERRA
jgi:hypothetical protein